MDNLSYRLNAPTVTCTRPLVATIAALCLFVTAPSFGQGDTTVLGPAYAAELLEKVCFVLTGRSSQSVLTAQTVADFHAGQRSLANIADELYQHPLFINRYAAFYLQVLRIGQTIDWVDVLNAEAPPLVNPDNQGDMPNTLLNNVTRNARYRVLSYNSLYCNDDGPTRGVYYINATNQNGRVPGLMDCLNDCSTSRVISPFWNPSTQVRICSDLERADICGPQLSLCFPDPSNPVRVSQSLYPDHIRHALTYEPGVLAAKIIADERSWDDLVLTTSSVVNGAFADFVIRFGRSLLDVSPSNTYPERNTDPVFTTADPTASDNWQRVEKGSGHAGVLTTMAFQRTTNGWRAKANRAMDVFLCREFHAADASVPVVSTETDLTRKPFCSQCHVILEPMAQFFGKWPNVGNNNNYFYSRDPNRSAAGRFNGESGVDTRDFAQIITRMEDYNTCAVKRAFTFVMGRDMSEGEATVLLGPWTQQFVAGGKRLFPIMKEMMNSKIFTGQP